MTDHSTVHSASPAEEGSSHEEHPLVPYRVYILVWLALLALTAVTVGVKYADLQHLAIFTAIAIATVKAALVLLYFMHIRYERRIFALMILVFLVTYGVFVGLIFVDYPFR